MGLFDGPTRAFAGKVVAALRKRAAERVELMQQNAGHSQAHSIIALALIDVADIITEVAGLGD